jgi:integrase
MERPKSAGAKKSDPVRCCRQIGGWLPKNSGKEIDMSEHSARLFREWALKSGVRADLFFRFKDKITTYRKIEYRCTKALEECALPFRAIHILRHASLTEYYRGCRDLISTAKAMRDMAI